MGDAVGDELGEDVVGEPVVGDEVGANVVGEPVVGDEVGEVVGDAVGNAVGDAVGNAAVFGNKHSKLHMSSTNCNPRILLNFGPTLSCNICSIQK